MNENRNFFKPKAKKKKYINNDGLFLQAILSAVVVLLALSSIFVIEFLIPMELMLAFLMFVMAYNNQTTYGKDNRTMIYVICAFVALFSFFFDLLF